MKTLHNMGEINRECFLAAAGERNSEEIMRGRTRERKKSGKWNGLSVTFGQASWVGIWVDTRTSGSHQDMDLEEG